MMNHEASYFIHITTVAIINNWCFIVVNHWFVLQYLFGSERDDSSSNDPILCLLGVCFCIDATSARCRRNAVELPPRTDTPKPFHTNCKGKHPKSRDKQNNLRCNILHHEYHSSKVLLLKFHRFRVFIV